MDNLQKINQEWFETLRDRLCKDYQRLESKTKFKKTTWQRGPRAHNGGGVMMLLQGGVVFEKVGVNVSTVRGVIDERYRNQVMGAGRDGAFFATGISVVAHPRNPHVPAMHFNTRYLETTVSWWGGGMDQTPSHPNKKSIELWHHTLKETCENNHKSHAEYRKQCDEYFYIRHRDEVRGAGGIFFDHLLLSHPNAYIGDFVFIQRVGEAFHSLSLQIIDQNQHKKYTAKDKQIQNRKRGRYVEFNLMYDRGTQFGLNTGGNVEAILMSLPPQAEW
jgi:coproporphyrinogen III oxidase